MATPVTDPAILAQLNKTPVSDPAILAQLNGEKGPQFNITDAVTDIPREIGATADRNLTAVEQGLSNRGSKGPIEGLLGTGKAVLSGLGLIASPLTGAARSLIGHPMAQAEHAAGTVIAPEIAAKDDPKKMYEAAAGDAETAMMAAKPGTLKAPPVAAPTVAELKTASRAAYNSPEVAAVQIKPQSSANLATKIESDLAQRGFRPNNEGPVFEVIKELTPAPGISSVNVADIDSARKALGIMAREKDAVGQATSKAAAATIARDHINDYLPNIAPADVLAGDAVRAAEILKEARGNWAAAKRGEQVDLQLTRAERQAAKSGAGSNIENSMRQKIATILDNPKRAAAFSDAEKQAMETIVRGDFARNSLRKAGKLGVDGGLSLAWNTAAALGSGGTTLPITAGSTLARKIGEKLTARAGTSLSEMTRTNSPLGANAQGTAAVKHALFARQPTKAALVSSLLGLPSSGQPSHMKRMQLAKLLAQL